MAKTLASQHIYTRVEAHESRERVAGYQTLYYTHAGMTRAEAVELESRLVCYPTSATPPKKVFSVTSTGNLAVSQVVSQHVPQQQRPWIGLAHSLVASAGTAVPFSLFHQFTFLTSFDQALAAGDSQTGDIAAVEVLDDRDWQRQAIQTARGWSMEEMRKLAFLTFRAERLASERVAVAVVGPPAAIESVLCLAHLLLPDALCPQCTFDTHFCDEHGNPCNLTGSSYWAVGLPSAPSSPQFVVVDAQAGRVAYAAKWKANGPYERWIEAQLTAGNWDAVANQRNQAFALAQLLKGKPHDFDLVRAAPPALIGDIFDSHRELVDAWLLQRLAETVGSPLASRLPGAVHRCFPKASQLLAKVTQGFRHDELAGLLFSEFSAAGFRRPEEPEIAAVKRLLGQVNHGELALLYAFWTGQESLQHRLATELPEDAYRNVVRGILASRQPESLSLLVPAKARVFVDLYLRNSSWQVIPLTTLVERLVQIGAGGHLEPLSPRLSHEPKNALRKIREQVSRCAETPATFRSALEEAWEDSSKQAGFLKRLFHPW